EFDARRWIIPPARMKSDEPHAVPLAPAVVEILRTLLDRQPLPRGKAYVLGGTVHYVRAKQRLDTRLKVLNGGNTPPPLTRHHHRRTFRTGLSRLQIPPHIAELCIAHAQPGLHKVYDQHKFEIERRHAFEAWAAHVLRVVAPPADVVVPLRSAT